MAGKYLEAYGEALKKSFRDGFPNGTSYQRRETKGLAVTFLRGPETHEVFMTVPHWTPKGQTQKTFLHSLVVNRKPGYKRGEILKPSTKRVVGTVRNFNGISWNRT